MAARRKAIVRLQRDLRELADRAWELPTVAALPLEDNMLEWHCNIVGHGDHDGVVLHLKLLFPETYPFQPPEVVLMSKVHHPHVFGDHLCLDMLEEGQWADSSERDAEFTGWSSCYSVFSILMQLQAFLFDLGDNAVATGAAASKCECYCGHGLFRTYPPFPEPMDRPARAAVADDCFSGDDAPAAPLEPPEQLKGRVTRVERYGFFVLLDDGRKGLLHRSECSRSIRYEPGDAIACTIKGTSPQGLQLTMRLSDEHLDQAIASCSPIPATVTGVKAYGAFVDIGGHSVLLHRTNTDYASGGWLPWQHGDSLPVRLSRDEQGQLQASQRSLVLRPQRLRFLDLGDACLDRLRCFHSKAPMGEAVFGVGVALEAEDVQGQTRYHLSSIYDVLSLESFRDGVRRGVWKQKFTQFLPLALDSEHFEQGKRALEDLAAKLCSGTMAEKLRSHGKSREERAAELRSRITLDEYRRLQSGDQAGPAARPCSASAAFAPHMLLDILPKLMNSQVVLLSSGQLWRSQKALEGYFAYHHLLLHCLRAYPNLRNRVEKSLDAFCQSPEHRSKQAVPNLGEFLCLLSVSDSIGWDDIGVPLLEEAFARNALWILKQAPKLSQLNDIGVSQYRLEKSFKANRVSLRLLMFQVAFLQLARPQGHRASGSLERKDRCKGLPGPGEAEWLFQRCVRILAVEDWSGFLELVGAAPMDDAEVCRWLRRAMVTSVSRGYHNPWHFERLCVKEKPQASTGHSDPEDFGMDTRKKESKAEKRAKKQAATAAREALRVDNANQQSALNWARFHSGGRFQPRQAMVMISDQRQLDELEAEVDPDGALMSSYGGAQRGWRILDGKAISKVKSFPAWLLFGCGCRDCGKLVRVEMSGRCLPCCKYLASQPKTTNTTSVLPGLPEQNFRMFDAEAVNPVEFEMQLEVKFDGLCADLTPLRKVLTPNLELNDDLAGVVVFTRVSRMGKRLFERAPEQAMTAGCQLVAGWQGVTVGQQVKKATLTVSDGLFTTTVRNVTFTLLRDSMNELTALEDLELLRMTRTFCPDHRNRDRSSKAVMCRAGHALTSHVLLHPGACSECHTALTRDSEISRCQHCNYDLCQACSCRNMGVIWNQPCENCRGILRLRFRAPQRYATRERQLERLSAADLAKRAALCGMSSSSAQRKKLIAHILKSEKIIR